MMHWKHFSSAVCLQALGRRVQEALPGADGDGFSEKRHVCYPIGVEGYGCGCHRPGGVWQQPCKQDQHAKGPGLCHLPVTAYLSAVLHVALARLTQTWNCRHLFHLH